MLRRLMLSALALSALLALAGCGATQLVAPEVATDVAAKPKVLGKNEPVTDTTNPPAPQTPERRVDPRREGDGDVIQD